MQNASWDPYKLIKISGSYWEAFAIHAGVKTDVFTAIGSGSITSLETAQKTGADTDSIVKLMNALTAIGLLNKKEDRFSNTSFSKKYLSKDSSDYLGFAILHQHYISKLWSQLDKAVITGKPVRAGAVFEDDKKREAFLMGMFCLGTIYAPLVAEEIDLSGKKHILDMGGGPGAYSVHFCLKNPELKATVFDLPGTGLFAEKKIEELGFAGRINFISGNYLNQDIAGIYDAVWMSHILHSQGPDQCLDIIKKAIAALEPGGLIMIQDFILEDDKSGPVYPALFSLNMLLGTETGRAYSEKEIKDMMQKAGIENIKRIYFKDPLNSGVIVGNKK